MITIALITRVIYLYNKRKQANAAKLVPVRSTYTVQTNP